MVIWHVSISLFKQRIFNKAKLYMMSVKHTRFFYDFFVDGIEPPGTRIQYRVRTSIDVMLANVLCSLCHSIQNQSQKRRCKQQNCLARILWWWNAEIIRNDTLDFFLLLNSWIKCSIFLSHYWNIFILLFFFNSNDTKIYLIFFIHLIKW